MFDVSVPRTVLREQYDERPEKDETLDSDHDIESYDVVDDALREGSVYSASPNLGGGQPPVINTSTDSPSESPPRHHWSEASIPKGKTTCRIVYSKCMLNLAL